MQTGERYRCTDQGCGCEIEVLKASAAKDAGMAPRCCCGRDMKRVESQAGSSIAGEMRST